MAQQQQHGGAPPPPSNANQALGGQLNLEALRDNPQIQQLRQQMAQNPALIQPLIQQLASQNPAIAQIIAQNPEALFQLLGIELDDGEEEGSQIPPGAHVVSVTEEERAAIRRVSSYLYHLSIVSYANVLDSWKVLDFLVKPFWRLISHATRMKSLLLIISSKAGLMINSPRGNVV